jgi:hypothetical protein
MPLYRVLFHGKDFPGVILGKSKPIGFYTTRFVHAADEPAAEAAALATLREAPELNIALQHRTSVAKVFVEELEVALGDREQRPNTGFTFYENET